MGNDVSVQEVAIDPDMKKGISSPLSLFLILFHRNVKVWGTTGQAGAAGRLGDAQKERDGHSTALNSRCSSNQEEH